MFKNGKHPKEFILPSMTICIILIIVIITGITRATVNIVEDTENIKEGYFTPFTDVELNESERVILGMFFADTEISIDQQGEENNTYYIYVENLYKHLRSSGVELGISQAVQMREKVSELIEIMRLEGKNDFTDMSVDGKALAVDIAKQIYMICGLTLKTNRDGLIERISVINGPDIYQDNYQVQETGFHTYLFLISLCFLISLFVIIVIIVKRNLLFKRGVGYDGFDEERFA